MFEGLSNRLGEVFDRLKKRGALSESDVSEALREVRIALLEADVALPVVKDFVNSVKERAVGAEVIKSITPGQMVVKIVHDHLVELLGGTVQTLDLVAAAPVVVMTPAPVAPPVPAAPVAPPAPEPIPAPEPAAVVETPEPAAPAARPRKKKPEIPAWEDVLLGVRANGQR